MDIAWPYQRRELGDTIDYTCPSNTVTRVESKEGRNTVMYYHISILIIIRAQNPSVGISTKVDPKVGINQSEASI